MGEFFVAPLIILAIAGLIWAFFFLGKTSKARRAEESLPDDPYSRRDEEIRRLRAEHEEARPERVTHPARRP
ncbi:MAG: hypothetical protein JO222_10285 [Frankiales bacterium]|nr:hypothetical protein [Frankiales bacterium]